MPFHKITCKRFVTFKLCGSFIWSKYFQSFFFKCINNAINEWNIDTTNVRSILFSFANAASLLLSITSIAIFSPIKPVPPLPGAKYIFETCGD